MWSFPPTRDLITDSCLGWSRREESRHGVGGEVHSGQPKKSGENVYRNQEHHKDQQRVEWPGGAWGGCRGSEAGSLKPGPHSRLLSNFFSNPTENRKGWKDEQGARGRQEGKGNIKIGTEAKTCRVAEEQAPNRSLTKSKSSS